VLLLNLLIGHLSLGSFSNDVHFKMGFSDPRGMSSTGVSRMFFLEGTYNSPDRKKNLSNFTEFLSGELYFHWGGGGFYDRFWISLPALTDFCFKLVFYTIILLGYALGHVQGRIQKIFEGGGVETFLYGWENLGRFLRYYS